MKPKSEEDDMIAAVLTGVGHNERLCTQEGYDGSEDVVFQPSSKSMFDYQTKDARKDIIDQ